VKWNKKGWNRTEWSKMKQNYYSINWIFIRWGGEKGWFNPKPLNWKGAVGY